MKIVALLIVAALISSNYAINFKHYRQYDPAWKDQTLSGGQTLHKVGCLMSSVAMILTTFNRPCGASPCTPGALNSWLKKNNGYQGNNFVWGSVASLGLAYLGQPSDKAVIANHVKSGNFAILNVRKGGHWVLATGVDSGSFPVNDPGYPKTSYTFAEVVRAGIFKKTFFTLYDLL